MFWLGLGHGIDAKTVGDTTSAIYAAAMHFASNTKDDMARGEAEAEQAARKISTF